MRGYLSARGTTYSKKYFSRKLGCFCLVIVPLLLLAAVPIILGPVLLAVAHHIISVAQVHPHAINVTGLSEASFATTISGQLKKVGIFPAHAYFREPVDIFWYTPPPELREVHLLRLRLDYVGVANGHGRIHQATEAHVQDAPALARFISFLVNQPQATIKVNCSSVHAEAFGFLPAWKNIPVSTHVHLKGLDALRKVKILDLQIPADDPAGGATVEALAMITNPSPLGLAIPIPLDVDL